MAKVWIEPKAFHYTELNAKNCIPGDEKSYVRITEVKSKNQVHHNFRTTPEHNEQGKFTVQFDAAMTGSVNSSLGDDGISTSYSFWMEIYAGYQRMYQDMNRVADGMLSRLSPTITTAVQLQAQLFEQLAKKAVKEEEVQRAIGENLARGKEMSPDVFRQVVLCCLLPEQMVRDPDGTALMKFCVEQKRDYCVWLDANVALKEQIYGAVKIADAMVDKPTAELFNDLFKWTTHPGNHPTLANKIDYSKSPAISFKMLSSVPKPGQKTTGKIRISEANEVMWTVIYDYINRSLKDAAKPIATLEEFLFFTYTKGDSKRADKPRPAFRLMQEAKTLEPTVFWGELTKRGQFQFKVIESHITRKIEFGGGQRTLSQDDVARRLAASRRMQIAHDIGGGGDDGDQQQDGAGDSYHHHHDDAAGYDDDAGEVRKGEKRGGGGEGDADDTRPGKTLRLFEPL